MYFAEEMRSKGNFYIQTVDQKRKYATFTFYSILILMANCVWDAYAQNT